MKIEVNKKLTLGEQISQVCLHYKFNNEVYLSIKEIVQNAYAKGYVSTSLTKFKKEL